MEDIRVAALSPPFKRGNKEHNLNIAYKGLKAAKEKGVELALFSEAYLTGFCGNERSWSISEPVPDGCAVRKIIRFAEELKMFVSMGVEEKDISSRIVYNTHFLTGPKGYIGKYRKTHLMTREMQYYRPGCEVPVFDIGKCVIGIEICHDNMYPELSRVQTLMGMEVLLSPFGMGRRQKKNDWLNDFHMSCFRARAFDNGIYMLLSGGNGEDCTDSHPYCGYTCLIDPYAEIVSPIPPEPKNTFNMIVVDLKKEIYNRRRRDSELPIRKRRPELYKKLSEKY